MNEPRHFITGTELRPDELAGLIKRARALKDGGDDGLRPLQDMSVAIFLARPSTRTRVVLRGRNRAARRASVVLRSDELQLARGESVRDTALVLSRYVDAIVARVGDHETIEELARYAEVPVVNALTPAPPSLPGAGRPADAAGAVRLASRGCASPMWATATTSATR